MVNKTGGRGGEYFRRTLVINVVGEAATLGSSPLGGYHAEALEVHSHGPH